MRRDRDSQISKICFKNVVDHVLQDLPDRGNHFWLASSPHLRNVFLCFAHLLCAAKSKQILAGATPVPIQIVAPSPPL
jgi:hypothetical protein